MSLRQVGSSPPTAPAESAHLHCHSGAAACPLALIFIFVATPTRRGCAVSSAARLGQSSGCIYILGEDQHRGLLHIEYAGGAFFDIGIRNGIGEDMIGLLRDIDSIVFVRYLDVAVYNRVGLNSRLRCHIGHWLLCRLNSLLRCCPLCQLHL